MGRTLSDCSLDAQWSAGFGEVVTRVRVNGPGTFRFEITPAGGPTLVFRSNHEVAMAIYHSGQRVVYSMSSEQLAGLIVAGAARAEAAGQDVTGDVCETQRYERCVGLASRIISLTDRPWSYPKFPQWHPAWRVNELENLPVPLPRVEADMLVVS